MGSIAHMVRARGFLPSRELRMTLVGPRKRKYEDSSPFVLSEVEVWASDSGGRLARHGPPPYQVRGRLFDSVGRRATRAPSHSAQDARIK